MKKRFILFGICLLIVTLTSCLDHNPNTNETGKDEFKALELDHKLSQDEINYEDIFYVPIYSDIYVSDQNQKSLLAATLSIRNTSYTDSLFISVIDYFNSHGDLVRSYINKPISISPMATVNYVIEKEDTEGGSGANFIVTVSAKTKNIKPIIQAIMIGENRSTQSFAFSTDGYSIKNK